MKTTNHINKLADKIASKSEYTSASYIAEELQNIKNALLAGRYYTCVERVSASGMSRVIKIAYIKNNKLHGVSSDIYKLAGCNKNGSISGCGMDMLFAAQYDLFRTLCPRHRYQDKMPSYNSL